MGSKIIYVYADWSGSIRPTLVGNLRVESIRGNEVFSFEYDDNWLNTNQSFVLDPQTRGADGKTGKQAAKESDAIRLLTRCI